MDLFDHTPFGYLVIDRCGYIVVVKQAIAASNAYRHAQVTWVLISAHKENQKMRITIQDNGGGDKMAPPMVVAARSQGLGLSTMDIHCHMIGRLDVKNAVESGTQLTVWLPCHPRQEGE
jgi:signal transduction histidine kinase